MMTNLERELEKYKLKEPVGVLATYLEIEKEIILNESGRKILAYFASNRLRVDLFCGFAHSMQAGFKPLCYGKIAGKTDVSTGEAMTVCLQLTECGILEESDTHLSLSSYAQRIIEKPRFRVGLERRLSDYILQKEAIAQECVNILGKFVQLDGCPAEMYTLKLDEFVLRFDRRWRGVTPYSEEDAGWIEKVIHIEYKGRKVFTEKQVHERKKGKFESEYFLPGKWIDRFRELSKELSRLNLEVLNPIDIVDRDARSKEHSHSP